VLLLLLCMMLIGRIVISIVIAIITTLLCLLLVVGRRDGLRWISVRIIRRGRTRAMHSAPTGASASDTTIAAEIHVRVVVVAGLRAWRSLVGAA
jgi:hypothetical protein